MARKRKQSVSEEHLEELLRAEDIQWVGETSRAYLREVADKIRRERKEDE